MIKTRCHIAMKQTMYKIALFCMLAVTGLSTTPVSANTNWKAIAPGLSYKKVENVASFSDGAIHAFQIDPNAYQFEIALTGQPRSPSIPGLMKQRGAAIAVNGGFFSPEMASLGLRVSKGSLLAPIKATSWWGVFYIKRNHPHIVAYKNYQSHPDVHFAVQAGPRLVVDGKIPKLKPGVSYRTALGIQPSNKIILLVTEDLLLSTQELAEIMRRPEEEGGLNCPNALNLDGGRSTQLYAWLDRFSLQLPGLTQVADFILVVPKK
jgi:uncharacterized protein YigE (DUF2233 family)